ncbi:polyphosphate polymerase domain-containing protein [bacterium]|nr:polyphosphate polymerase domain-containing protein [bacterium]
MTNQIQQYFRRFEFKYIIDIKTRNNIIEDITPFCYIDENTQENGEYSVHSLYYDSDNFKSYFEKINGEKYRRKIRIRQYPGSSGDMCFIEIKGKNNNNVFKKRVFLSLRDAMQVLSRIDKDSVHYSRLSEGDKKIVDEIWFMHKYRNLHKKSVVSYKRKAFKGKFGKRFRLTFDRDLRVRKTNLDNLRPHDGKLIMNPNIVIMEVKFNEYVPTWMIKVLNKYDCTLNKVSKYCVSIDALYNFGSK